MATILAQKLAQAQEANNAVRNFMRRFEVGKLLSVCRASKSKGFSVVELFRFLLCCGVCQSGLFLFSGKLLFYKGLKAVKLLLKKPFLAVIGRRIRIRIWIQVRFRLHDYIRIVQHRVFSGSPGRLWLWLEDRLFLLLLQSNGHLYQGFFKDA